jgi:Cu/Ag efflux pump CusA
VKAQEPVGENRWYRFSARERAILRAFRQVDVIDSFDAFHPVGYLRYHLLSIPGVAEVAAVGGFAPAASNADGRRLGFAAFVW